MTRWSPSASRCGPPRQAGPRRWPRRWPARCGRADGVLAEARPLRSSEEDRAEAVAALKEGAAGAGLRRRPLILASLFGAVAPLLLVPLAALRDLGPLPGAKLTGTYWKPGRRLVTDPQGEPIKAADVPIGGVIHVQPEGVFEAEHSLDERAKATA